jgi:hypothetical protein
MTKKLVLTGFLQSSALLREESSVDDEERVVRCSRRKDVSRAAAIFNEISQNC